MKKLIISSILMSLSILSYAQQQTLIQKNKNAELFIKQDSFVNALGKDGLEFNAITVIYKFPDGQPEEATYRAYATTCNAVQGPVTETSADGKKLIDFRMVEGPESSQYSVLKSICDNYSQFKENPQKFTYFYYQAATDWELVSKSDTAESFISRKSLRLNEDVSMYVKLKTKEKDEYIRLHIPKEDCLKGKGFMTIKTPQGNVEDKGSFDLTIPAVGDEVLFQKFQKPMCDFAKK